MILKEFKKIEYLLDGNKRQIKAYEAIKKLNILNKLKNYNPILVGTIPIDIDVPGSDLDIICEVYDFNLFKSFSFENFSMHKDYVFSEKYVDNNHIAVINFVFMNFEFELYCKSEPTTSFNGYKHMIIEYRLLILFGKKFRDKIKELKKSGLKTEPSFAKLLGLKGDPYKEILKLEDYTDQELIKIFENTYL